MTPEVDCYARTEIYSNIQGSEGKNRRGALCTAVDPAFGEYPDGTLRCIQEHDPPRDRTARGRELCAEHSRQGGRSDLPKGAGQHVLLRCDREHEGSGGQEYSEFAGFTTGTPWLGIPANHSYINVETEEKDPDSILAFYKQLVRLRKENEIIADGEIRFLGSDSDDVIAYERTLGDEKLTVYCNLRDHEVPANGMPQGDILISNYAEPGGADVLRPFEARVIKG